MNPKWSEGRRGVAYTVPTGENRVVTRGCRPPGEADHRSGRTPGRSCIDTRPCGRGERAEIVRWGVPSRAPLHYTRTTSWRTVELLDINPPVPKPHDQAGCDTSGDE